MPDWSRLRSVTDIDRPWPWLALLPLYSLPWFWRAPGTHEIAAAAAGVCCFLPLYLAGMASTGPRLLATAAAILLLAAVLASFDGGWPVLVVFAAAMLSRQRPFALGIVLAVCAALAGAALGLAVGGSLPLAALTAFLASMVGFASASRAALLDRAEELTAAQEEVRRLGAAAERDRLAGDVHDLLGRSLTLIAVRSDLAGRALASRTDGAAAEVAQIGRDAREALGLVRQVLAGGPARDLDREVEASLAALRAASIGCEGSLAGAAALPPQAAAVLGSVLREAVTNVIRHAGASRVLLGLSLDAGFATLSVVDDGRGAGSQPKQGMGLAQMRTRVEGTGGRLTVRSCDGGGTAVEARVPVFTR